MAKIPEMRTRDEISRAILENVVFTPKLLEHYGNWKDIPKTTALRLYEQLFFAIKVELEKYAAEIASGYLYYPEIGTRSLVHFTLAEEPIKIKFNPDEKPNLKGLTKDERFDAIHVRRIFKRRIARNLWLGIKPCFITSQYFIPDIERMASMIYRTKPKCWHDLFLILAQGKDFMFSRGNSTVVREMAILLFPYVTGKRDFEWIVVKE
jgi:hypothetical protein